MMNRYDTREHQMERFCNRYVPKMSDADLDLALQLNSVQAERTICAALEKEQKKRAAAAAKVKA
jgi:hypothetical protein